MSTGGQEPQQTAQLGEHLPVGFVLSEGGVDGFGEDEVAREVSVVWVGCVVYIVIIGFEIKVSHPALIEFSKNQIIIKYEIILSDFNNMRVWKGFAHAVYYLFGVRT